jgi:hypothetical protein
MRPGSWDVIWIGRPEIVVHLGDRTKGQAKAEVLRRVRDAGYRATFPEMKARSCRLAGTIFCGAWR